MEKLPIHYRAAVWPRRRRSPVLGTPGNYFEAEADAYHLAVKHKATVVTIQKTDPWPINAGKWYLGRILK